VDRRAVACCALAALVTSLGAALATMAPFDWTASVLVHVGDAEPMGALARTTDSGFHLVPMANHYDGTYFYAMARDPFATGKEHTLIDRPAYRYGHPGYGWLSTIAAVGDEAVLPWAMLLVALVCATLAGGAAAALAQEMGLSPWWGLGVALNPGLVYSVTALTSEAAGLAALFGGLLAWRLRRFGAAAAIFALGCFVKEPLVLVPVGVALFELVRRFRARGAAGEEPLPLLARRIGLLAIGPVLYLCWYGYVWHVFHASPASQASDLTGAPFVGWIDTLREAGRLVGADFMSAQLGALTVPLLVVAGVAVLVGLLRSLTLRTPVEAVYVLLACLALTLNSWNLLYPKDLVRALTLQVTLLPFLFAPREAEA
jgi:hypothetical protein